MIDHFVSQVFYVPGLHFNFDALRNGRGKRVPRNESVASQQQVVEDVTRQVCLQWLDFTELTAPPDGIDFSHYLVTEREGKRAFINPRKKVLI